MTKYFAVVDKATNVIRAVQQVGDKQLDPQPPAESSYTMVAITETQRRSLAGPLLFEGSSQHRYAWDGGSNALVTQTDSRTLVALTLSAVPPFDVGQAGVTLTFTALDRGSRLPDASVTGTHTFTVDDRPVKLTFALGVATIDVDTSRARLVRIASREFELRDALEFAVLDNKV